MTVMGNTLAFWNHERLGVEISPGIDEVSLALAADAWSRTYRSRAVTFAEQSGVITTRNGVRIVPDEAARPQGDVVSAFGDRPPAQALNETLAGIESRYGAGTRYVVAMQLEYPQKAE